MTAAVFSRWVVLLLVQLSVAVAAIGIVVYSNNPCASKLSQSSSTLTFKLGLESSATSTPAWQVMQIPSTTTLYTSMQIAGWQLDIKCYGSLGVLILGINGVEQSGGNYWEWYSWKSSQWALGPVGASSYMIQSGDMILWYYGSSTPSPNLSLSSFTVIS